MLGDWRHGLSVSLVAVGACGPAENSANVTAIVAVVGEQPAVAVQWDNVDLRHPRADLFAFDGRAWVPQAGITTGIVRPAALVGAVARPTAVFVLRPSAGPVWAAGADGYALPSALASASLASFGEGFIAPAQQAVAEGISRWIVSLDDVGRERWRSEPFVGAPCPLLAPVTPDGARALSWSAASHSLPCTGLTKLRVYAPDGALVTAQDLAPPTAPEGAALTVHAGAARSDLAFASGASWIIQQRTTGSLWLYDPGSTAPRRLDLGAFAPTAVAPVGPSLWLVAGILREYRERGSGASSYTSVTERPEAWLLNDRGDRRWSQRLANSVTAPPTLVAAARATALFYRVPGREPAVIVFGPDGARLFEGSLPLAARAAMVQPSLPDAGP